MTSSRVLRAVGTLGSSTGHTGGALQMRWGRNRVPRVPTAPRRGSEVRFEPERGSMMFATDASKGKNTLQSDDEGGVVRARSSVRLLD